MLTQNSVDHLGVKFKKTKEGKWDIEDGIEEKAMHR